MTNLSNAAAILGRKGGQAKSPAKTAAARANARKPRPVRSLLGAVRRLEDSLCGEIDPQKYAEMMGIVDERLREVKAARKRRKSKV